MANLIVPDPKMLFFTTRDFAHKYRISLTSASQRLQRLESAGTINKLTRGIWYQPQQKGFHRLMAIPSLLGNEQGYLSFLSALNHYDVIEQIPSSILIATTGFPRSLKTSLGTYEFLKISPHMMTSGIHWFNGPDSFLIAEPEKALLDTLYISTRKGRRFSSLPEVDFSSLKPSKFRGLVKKQIRSTILQSAVLSKFEELNL